MPVCLLHCRLVVIILHFLNGPTSVKVDLVRYSFLEKCLLVFLVGFNLVFLLLLRASFLNEKQEKRREEKKEKRGEGRDGRRKEVIRD